MTLGGSKFGPGRSASARLILAGLALALSNPALAQSRRPAPAAAAAVQIPAPDQLNSLKMVWGIMAAVDQANRTGNYSVLRDLGSAGFQSRNNPANLGSIFAELRNQGIDLSNALIVNPNWDIPPTMVQPGTLRMRGSFPLRPAAILFDLLFVWDGGWRLEGIAVQAQPGR